MRQKFGQHFLKDEAALRAIADALQIQENDAIIEIGPGHGELTNFIIAQASAFLHTKIFLLERDTTLIPELTKKFDLLIKSDKLQIIEGDALYELPKLVLSSKFPHKYKLIGNIPYYITGQLFRVIEGLTHKPALSVFTIQKEVAERVTAEVGAMNLLAASVQYFADTELLTVLPKKLFSPPPEVDSAIIRLTPHIEKNKIPPEFYYATIKALFKQPRKTVLNNLKTLEEFKNLSAVDQEKIFAKLGISPTLRPQHMHISAIKQLAFVLYNK